MIWVVLFSLNCFRFVIPAEADRGFEASKLRTPRLRDFEVSASVLRGSACTRDVAAVMRIDFYTSMASTSGYLGVFLGSLWHCFGYVRMALGHVCVILG